MTSRRSFISKIDWLDKRRVVLQIPPLDRLVQKYPDTRSALIIPDTPKLRNHNLVVLPRVDATSPAQSSPILGSPYPFLRGWADNNLCDWNGSQTEAHSYNKNRGFLGSRTRGSPALAVPIGDASWIRQTNVYRVLHAKGSGVHCE